MGAALVFLTTAFSGCLALRTNEAVKQTMPGKITLKAVVCASNYKAAANLPECKPTKNAKRQDNTAEDATTTQASGQLLVGFRVPLGTVGPPSFSSKDGAADFTLSPSYTTELQRLFPASADQQWMGYISGVERYEPTPASKPVELNVDFKLPTSAGGAVLPTFRWRQVVGFRPGTTADAPVNCGNDNPDAKYCVDSPPRSDVDEDITTDVSDFGMLPGASVTAYAGTTARVPFQLRYSDKGGLGREGLLLAATTEVPGTRAVAEPRTIDAAPNSTSAANALVAVPAGTPGGRYTVTLSAATGAPPVTRANTGTIFVQPLPPGPPPLPITSPIDNRWTAFKSGTRVDNLAVKKVPAGGKVTIRCLRGRGSCKFKSKSFKGRRTVKLTSLFRHRKLKPKTVVEVSITADKRIGKLVRYTVRKRPQTPATRTLCEPPGSPKPLPCED
jgi:hypothetical protein